MAQMNEKETPFELIEALLKYIETLQVAGAVLVFLPGWNLIYSMQKQLEMNAHFGQLNFGVSVIQPVEEAEAADEANSSIFFCVY